MADINIQRKSSNAVWWILGIVALVIVAWFLFTMMGGDTTPRVGTTDLYGLPVAAAFTVVADAAQSLTTS